MVTNSTAPLMMDPEYTCSFVHLFILLFVCSVIHSRNLLSVCFVPVFF